MNLREFINMVASESSDGCYAYVAIESKTHKFQGRRSLWSDNALGFSWAKREGFGNDWELGKVPVIGIKVIKAYNQYIPCAVID